MPKPRTGPHPALTPKPKTAGEIMQDYLKQLSKKPISKKILAAALEWIRNNAPAKYRTAIKWNKIDIRSFLDVMGEVYIMKNPKAIITKVDKATGRKVTDINFNVVDKGIVSELFKAALPKAKNDMERKQIHDVCQNIAKNIKLMRKQENIEAKRMKELLESE